MTTPNKALQQILQGIGKHANQGRVNLDWKRINENRFRFMEAAPAPEDKEDDLPDLPTEEPTDKEAAPAPKAPAPKADKPEVTEKPDVAPTEDPSMDTDEEDADKAKEDAEKAKAELEKAKSEKDQAEQELEQNAYIKLNSPSGVSFLLGKLIDHAFKTNTMDALAGEFVNKLKITTPEDYSTFSNDMIPFKNIPGMVEFLDSVKSLSATGKQNPPEN